MKAKSNQQQRHTRSVFRRGLIMPTEHGSWAWLLVPFAVGAGAAGRFDLPVLLTLLVGLSIFFMRQPATVWMRVKRGRARKADGPAAAGWVAVLGSIALICFLALLALDHIELIWLAVPLIPIFAMYLLAARRGSAGLRTLWMELTGAAALALMAPAAFAAATGDFQTDAWTLWIIMAVQNLLGALYVRLRIFDTHAQPINRSIIAYAHLGGVTVILLLAILNETPLLSVVPFAGFLIRVIWAVSKPHPVANIKRFGFTEMGIEILSGGWIVMAGYL